jgi:hypothetical protein
MRRYCPMRKTPHGVVPVHVAPGHSRGVCADRILPTDSSLLRSMVYAIPKKMPGIARHKE